MDTLDPLEGGRVCQSLLTPKYPNIMHWCSARRPLGDPGWTGEMVGRQSWIW